MAYGDITGPIDTETWAAFDVYLPWLSPATGNIYLASFGAGIALRSIPIDGDGNIDPFLNQVVLEAGATGGIKSLVHISGDVYATAFAGAVNVKVVTFTCDAAGNLGGVIDTENLAVTPANKAHYPFLLHASGNIFIVAYTDNAVDGWIKTLRINDDGSIDPFIASWEHEAVQGRQPWLINVGGSMYAMICSSTASNFGRVRTFTVDGAGAIVVTGEEWVFEGNANGYNGGNIVRISAANNTFAIFYQGAASIGWVKTCTIDPTTGDIVPVDTWNYLPATVQEQFGIEVSSNLAGTGVIFCVGHTRNSAYQIWTLEILNDGTITEAAIDTLTLVAADWATNIAMVRVSPPSAIIFAAGYKDLTGANTGVIKTFEVEGGVTPALVGGLPPPLGQVLDI